MEVRPDYKRSELGTIPADWEVRLLPEVCRFRGGKAHEQYISDFGQFVCVNSKFISTEGRVRKYSTANFCPAKRDDILMVMSDLPNGRALAKAYLSDQDDLYAVNQRVCALTPYRDSPKYLFYVLNRNPYFLKFDDGVNQTHLLNHVFQKCPLPLPPTKAEQEAIAEALTDADALIGSLEQLVAKKRDIKQGALQSLLRLEPTDEVRPLGDVSSLKGRIGWQGLKQTEFTTNGDEPFLITGMNFKDGAIRWGEVYHISSARYEMAPEIQLRRNDVLMTKDGTIGKVLYIDAIPHPGKASLNSHLLLFRPIRGSYDPRYLYYQLSSRRFGDFVELSKSGTTFFGLSQAAVAAYPVVLPPMSRQVRIAAVLSDMDAEIAGLEAKLTKATRLKQGMMQELLTGRIRLV